MVAMNTAAGPPANPRTNCHHLSFPSSKNIAPTIGQSVAASSSHATSSQKSPSHETDNDARKTFGAGTVKVTHTVTSTSTSIPTQASIISPEQVTFMRG